ncbi:hypothetical protein JHS3_11090 [Jeongeupia sp. HS-3]|uniref:hypothetical protein n=1 Tax=Jeongeupia sp. HS-3 TaxID=1009682 RepID=UPI0018A3FEE9|nr:hypothetical protein [Jeongeupia sp. HS-3]BCL75373.1 hypothetical protein JHS3_11090 [Jeongeupia sp. HS-3]
MRTTTPAKDHADERGFEDRLQHSHQSADKGRAPEAENNQRDRTDWADRLIFMLMHSAARQRSEDYTPRRNHQQLHETYHQQPALGKCIQLAKA